MAEAHTNVVIVKKETVVLTLSIDEATALLEATRPLEPSSEHIYAIRLALFGVEFRSKGDAND